MEKAAQAGLTEYLKETEWASALVDWLHEETGISKGRLKLAVRLFAALVHKVATGAGSAAGGLAARAWEWLFARIPGNARIAQALAKLDRAKAAEVEFQAMVAGKILPQDAKLTEHLPPTLRAQFVTQAWLHRIADQVNPQPFLDFSCLDPETEAKRFVYTAQSVRLLGREHELEALSGFLSADVPFTWWVAEGPGGVGKSRLALEFSLAASGPWRMGFLRSLRDFQWQQWRPAAPTMLIVDYANETAEELGDIARGLAARAAQGDLAQPVRLLLLVREAEGAWKLQFLGTGARRAAIEQVRYADPLSVSPLKDDALWEVLRSALPPEVPLPDREDTLAKLLAIDPQRRPLFALFAGDAIKNGRDLRQWDATTLVSDVLEREKEHWKKAGATNKDLNLLALATMTGRMQTTQLADLDPSVFPAADGSVAPDSFDPARYEAMVGGARADRILSPLVPDILGEMFVLDHLQPRYAGDERRADALHRTSWIVSPEGMLSFLSRAAMDFPQNSTLPLLDRPPSTDALVARRVWSQAMGNLVAFYGIAGRLNDSWRVYRELCVLADAYAEDAVVREQRAVAGFNLVTVCGRVNGVDVARELYKELRTLSEAHPADGAVRELCAKCAFNVLNDYGSEGRVDEAREMYAELRVLSETHTDDAVVREQRSKAAFNLLNAYGRAGRTDEGRGIYAELHMLSEAHAADGVVRESRAMSAFNILIDYGSTGRVDEAREMYLELRALSEAAEDGEVRDLRAVAAFNLLTVYGSTGRLDEARELYGELCALAEANAPDGAVWESRIKSAYNLVNCYLSAGRVDEAPEMYVELRTLSESHQEDGKVRELRAMAAFNLLTVYGSVGRLDEARELYAELRALSIAHSDDVAVRKQRGRAAVNLLTQYATVRRMEDARELYEELRAFSEALAEDKLIGEQRVVAAVNLLIEYGRVGRVGEARELYAQLRALSDSNRDNVAVREQRAKAAFNLLHALRNAGWIDEAQGLYEELRDLAIDYPGEKLLTEIFAATQIMDDIT